MAVGRHLYRYVALSEHRIAMQQATQQWVDDSAQAAYDAASGRSGTPPASGGQALFQGTCAACHGIDKRIVGPPLTEIAKIYAKRPDGIVQWARAPGKKRSDAPQMPPFASLGDEKLRLIADYMLQAGSTVGEQ